MSERDLAELLRLIDPVCEAFEDACQSGQRPSVSAFLPEDWDRREREFLQRHLLDLERDYFGSTGTSEEDTTDGGSTKTAASTIDWSSFDKYELKEELGRGGMGVVYRARHRQLGRDVALKTLLLELSSDSAALARFRNEAETVASLEHPNIAPILEVGEFAGQPYIAMRYLGGGDLSARQEQYRGRVAETVDLLIVLADAVGAAHRRGLLHRDLKPANVLFDSEGTPYVSDFGLARRIDADTRMTMTGQVLGTPRFMSPEQARADSAALTVATDVYSLGAIGFELLCGRSVFEADSALSYVRKVLDEEAPALTSVFPDAPRDLEVILNKCLAKELSDRYRDAAALRRDLVAFRDGHPIAARPPTLWRRMNLWRRREPWRAAAASVAVIVLLGLAIGGPLIARRQGKLRRAAEDAQLREASQNEVLQDTLYASEMLAMGYGLADGGNEERLRKTLDRWRPAAAERDRRGFEWRYLKTQLDRSIFRARLGETIGLEQLGVFSEDPHGDGFFVLEGGALRRIEKREAGWALSEAQALPSLGALAHIAWSPDEERLVAVDRTGRAAIFDRNFELQPGSAVLGTQLRSIDWSPDGQRILVHGQFAPDAVGVRVWDLKTGECSELPAGRSMSIARWDQGGSAIIGVHLDQTGLCRLDPRVESKRVTRSMSFDRRFGGTRSLRLSPCRRRIAVVTDLDGVRLYDLPLLKPGPSLPTGGLRGRCAAWSPDGNLIAIAGGDRRVGIWDAQSGAALFEFGGHRRELTGLAWSADGKIVASIDIVGELALWSVDRPPRTRSFSAPIWEYAHKAFDISPDGRSLAVPLRNGVVELIDPVTLETKKVLSGDHGLISKVRFSPDGRELLVLGYFGSLWFYDLESGQVQRGSHPHPACLDGAWAHDASEFWITQSSGTISRWRRESKSVEPFPPHAFFQTTLAIPKDEARVVHGVIGAVLPGRESPTNAVTLRDSNSGELLASFDLERDIANGLSIDSARGLLAVATNAGDHLILRMEDLSLVKRLESAPLNGTAIVFSPDGRRLAATSLGGRLRLWETESWRLVFDVEAHEGAATQGLVWAPDSQTLFTLGLPGEVRRWSTGAADE